MKNIILCLYFSFLIGISQCHKYEISGRRTASNTVDTFEFVRIVNVGKVEFSKSGKIGPLEKYVRIPIVIPPCTSLSYVRVDVDNPIAPPHVAMDFDMSSVVIRYRPAQYSISSYVVTAKTVPSTDC